MSRPLSASMIAHLRQTTTTLAFLWRIIRRDGVVLGLTSHDRDLEKDGVYYRATPSFVPSALTTSRSFDPSNLELSGVLNSTAITEEDLASGKFDFAEVQIALVNWAHLEEGEIPLARGTLGDVRRQDEAFTAELRSPVEKLSAIVTKVYSPECRADFGDRCCRVDVSYYTHAARVISASSSYEIEASNLNAQINWYAYGRMRCLTGLSAGFEAEVTASTATRLSLATPLPKPVQAGDLIEVRAGCDRRFATCQGKFSNALNFRGEPFVPGADSVLKYPGL